MSRKKLPRSLYSLYLHCVPLDYTLQKQLFSFPSCPPPIALTGVVVTAEVTWFRSYFISGVGGLRNSLHGRVPRMRPDADELSHLPRPDCAEDQPLHELIGWA